MLCDHERICPTSAVTVCRLSSLHDLRDGIARLKQPETGGAHDEHKVGVSPNGCNTFLDNKYIRVSSAIHH